MSTNTRLSILINPATREALGAEMSNSGITATEAVRRAVAVLAFIREVESDGGKLQIEDRKGRIFDVGVLI